MPSTRAEILERIERIKHSRYCAAMSDDFAHTNGTIARFDREMEAAAAELKALDQEAPADA